MGSRRTLILVAAIAMAAIAAFLVWSYVGGVQDKAYGNAQRVKVFVVRRGVPRGTYGAEARNDKLVVESEIPKEFYPDNAVVNLDQVEGKVAVNNLAANQIVTADMFADATSVQTTFADRLEKINGKDQVAITISVDNVRGVANLLQPGDFVNIMVTQVCDIAQAKSTGAVKPTADTGGDACANSETLLFGQQARYLLQKVQILAIDQTPVSQPGEVQPASGEGAPPAAAATTPVNRGLITVIVPAKSAQYIASVTPGNIYLTLVPRDYEPTPQGPIDVAKPLPAEDPAELTPYGPDGAKK